MQYFAPRMRPVPPPCARDCPDRSGTWTLYESIRNHIYDVNHRGRMDMELDHAASRQTVRAENRIRRRKHYEK